MLVKDCLELYAEQHVPRIRAREQALIAIRHWNRFWRDLEVTDMTRERQERFHHWLDCSFSPAYVRRTLGVGRAALAFAGQSPPVTVHYCGAITAHERRPLAEHEAVRLWQAAQAQEHWRRYLWLAFGTGARPEALLQLRREQVRDGVVNLAAAGWRATKKRRPKLPLPPLLEREIARWDGDPLVNWKGKPIARAVEMFRRLRKASGVAATAYSCRHTIATEMHRAGVPPYEISIWLGHAPPGSPTTAQYIHHRIDFLAAARAAVDTYLRRLTQVSAAAKPLNFLVGARGIEPRTPTMSRSDCQELPDEWEWLQD